LATDDVAVTCNAPVLRRPRAQQAASCVPQDSGKRTSRKENGVSVFGAGRAAQKAWLSSNRRGPRRYAVADGAVETKATSGGRHQDRGDVAESESTVERASREHG
jgi:hypothetical protein